MHKESLLFSNSLPYIADTAKACHPHVTLYIPTNLHL